jgi:putative transport protein
MGGGAEAESVVRDAEPSAIIQLGDALAVVGRREVLVESALGIGPEIDDPQLVAFDAEVLDVIVTNAIVAGRTIQETRPHEAGSRRWATASHRPSVPRC